MTNGSFEHPNDLHRVAAEFALSLLEGPERTAAELRYGRDPVFRASVETWRDQFAGLADDLVPRPASAAVWRAIESQIGAPPVVQPEAGAVGWWARLNLWKTAAFAGFAATAALLALAVLPTVRGPTGGGGQPTVNAGIRGAVTAALLPKDGPALFVVTHDTGSPQLVVVPTGQPTPRDGRMVLWLLQGDDEPRPLGDVERDRTTLVRLSPDDQASLVAGVQLVVTHEPATPGAGMATPAGPVLAKGEVEQARI